MRRKAECDKAGSVVFTTTNHNAVTVEAYTYVAGARGYQDYAERPHLLIFKWDNADMPYGFINVLMKDRELMMHDVLHSLACAHLTWMFNNNQLNGAGKTWPK